MGAGFSFTEFVPAKEIARRDPEYLDMFRFEEQERPIIFQLFGNNEETIAKASEVAMEKSPDVIDLNMGCSVKQVAHNGSGAALLQNPNRAGRIIARMIRTVPVPVTAKIRLGWDDSSRNYLEVARTLEDAGVSMLSVHGRTKAQAYSGRADWNAIAEVKANVSIPVLGAGDVTGYEDALKHIDQYGVDGVLVGRNAIGNPWLFSGSDRSLIHPQIIFRVMIDHLIDVLEFHGPRGLIHFRKHAARYCRGFSGADELRDRLLATESFDAFVREVECFDLKRDFALAGD